MRKVFLDEAWKDYLWWLDEDGKIAKRINDLIRDIDRKGHRGIGKPEPLKYEFSGCWSRRITEKDRLIYRIDDDSIVVLSCRGHYDD